MTGRIPWRSLAASVLAIATLAVAGCAEDAEPSGPSHPVASAVRDIQAAFEEDDTAAICDRMTPEAQRQASKIAGGRATTCERDLQRAFGTMAADGWDGAMPVVTHVDHLYGNRTNATVKDGSWKADVAFAKQNGTWKLAGFVGVPPSEFERLEVNLRATPFKEYGSVSINVFDGAGKPCRDLRDRRHPKLTGGCIFRVSGTVPIRVLTPFGSITIADCAIEYRMAIAPWGHAYANEVDFAKGPQSRCSEITPCLTEEREPRPWTGYVDIGNTGGWEHHMLICLRTDVGLFGGEFVTRLLRDGKGWKVEPSDEGATGFKIDGELDVTGKPFTLRQDS